MKENREKKEILEIKIEKIEKKLNFEFAWLKCAHPSKPKTLSSSKTPTREWCQMRMCTF